MFSLIRKIFVLISVAFLIFLLCGCLAILLIYLYIAGEGEKDLSADFARGHIIGKEYEILPHKVFLTQFLDSKSLDLVQHLCNAYTFDEDGSEIKVNIYSMIEPISKGTRFKVCKVLAKTSFGSELCSQKILATLLDDLGYPIPKTNFQGKYTLIDVSGFFENTFEIPNENWVFKPKSNVIKELKIDMDDVAQIPVPLT